MALSLFSRSRYDGSRPESTFYPVIVKKKVYTEKKHGRTERTHGSQERRRRKDEDFNVREKERRKERKSRKEQYRPKRIVAGNAAAVVEVRSMW